MSSVVVKDLVYDVFLHHWQRDLEETLVRVEFGLTILFVNREWQQLVEIEVRALHIDGRVLHI